MSNAMEKKANTIIDHLIVYRFLLDIYEFYLWYSTDKIGWMCALNPIRSHVTLVPVG